VLRALRRDPTERYASAAELKARVSGLAARLVEVTPWRRRLRWVRYVAQVGVAPIAFLVAAFLLLWWYFDRKPQAETAKIRGPAVSILLPDSLEIDRDLNL
jgi:negative regulator of sigma E activity